ncbi:MAG: hypothetical protein WAQ24_02050 [Candidatus Saccharimonadales bacterium]
MAIKLPLISNIDKGPEAVNPRLTAEEAPIVRWMVNEADKAAKTTAQRCESLMPAVTQLAAGAIESTPSSQDIINQTYDMMGLSGKPVNQSSVSTAPNNLSSMSMEGIDLDRIRKQVAGAYDHV